MDLSGLALGSAIHLSEVQLPPGVQLHTLLHGGDPAQPVVSVHAPRVSAEAEEGGGGRRGGCRGGERGSPREGRRSGLRLRRVKPSPRLVVGLGNPGRRYTRTRHNAGLQFLERFTQRLSPPPRAIRRFRGPGRLLEVQVGKARCWLLASAAFMNESGAGVARARDYLHLAPEEMLIVHDELDLPPGTAMLKEGGGLGGHRGLRDITAHLHSQAYCRLRLGIGRPQERDRVTGYVLAPPDAHQQELLQAAIERAAEVLPEVLEGQMQSAMQTLHTGNAAVR